MNGTVGSERKRSTSDLRPLKRNSRLWPTRRGLRPRALRFALRLGTRERGLRRVECEALGQDGVVTAIEQGDEAWRQRLVAFTRQIGGVTGWD